MHQVSRSDNLLNMMPTMPNAQAQPSMGSDLIKNFNGMYEQPQQQQQQQQGAPPVQQVQQGNMGGGEPLAANEACMGMFGGSSF